MSVQPVSFISHSECDNGFCHALYDALCAKGIRPIMDTRDFQPGDDLVRRVYDEGIGKSDAVIFVLSPESVDRPWLRDELSVSVVHKIAARTRLIPLLIHDLPDERVPVALSATIWIRVQLDMTPAAVAERIATAMHGYRSANPVVDPPPAWTKEAIGKIYGLSSIDEVIFKYICEKRIETNYPFVSSSDVLQHGLSLDIPEDEIVTALSVLASRGYLDKGVQELGSRLPVGLEPSQYGLSTYLETYCAVEYSSIFQAVVAAMVNERAHDLETLKGVVSAPEAILIHVIDVLDSEGEIKAVHSLGGFVAWHVMPTLKRRLQ